LITGSALPFPDLRPLPPVLRTDVVSVLWQGRPVTDLQAALDAGPGWPSSAEGAGPLAGVRVLDLSRVLAGPYCCMVLGDLGADVLKVERPGVGDDTRRWGPPFHGDDAVYFFAANRDRRSVALDLTTPAGRAVVARLAGAADVVVENFLPRHLRALGLEALRAQASAVWVSVRGAGGDGPDGDKPGYDVMAQARSGLMSVTGTTEPTKVGVAVADVVTGLYAAVGALAGLVARPGRTTTGAPPLRVEVGLLEAAVAMLVNQAANALVGGVVPSYAGNDHPNLVPYGPVACADRPLVLGAGNDAQFAALCAALGLAVEPRWATNAGRVADRARLTATLAGVLGGRTAQEWVPVLEAAGVPCAPVQDLGSLPDDPQIAATGILQRVAHPAGDVRVVGSPYRLDGARPQVRRAPPLLGEHTAEVLSGLGLSRAHLEEVTGADRR
jgi:crotonobetainyl-CoA:carnitine CoA-transferase CaiB-like acyl-CoA transferase